MKKTSGTSGSNRPAVRNAITPVQLTNRTTGKKSGKKSSASSYKGKTKKTVSKSGRSGKSAKKKSGGKVAAFVVGTLAVAAVVGVVGFKYWEKNIKEKKYEVNLADGTVAELTVDELRSSINTSVFPQGTIINGVNVAGMTIDSARETVKANEPEAPLYLDIKLDLDGTSYPVDLSSLPLESNIEEILTEAFNYAKPSDNAGAEELVACYNRREQMKLTPVDYNTAYTLNSEGIGSIIHGILDPLASEARDAQITGFNTNSLQFEYTPSAKGYIIDVDKAVTDVKALLDSCEYVGTVAVEAQVTEPTFTTEMIQNDFGLIAESHSTTTSNNSRNHNIRITCEKIDGMVFQPGESFSFNDTVGQRTAAAGYEMAGTIVNGQYQDDYGGGICQVSTMIYQSCIKSDITVDKRNWHSWPSSYADPGTDATVDWGGLDFIFTNNKDYPIAMHAVYNNDDHTVSVSFYGPKLPGGIYYDFIGSTVSVNPHGTVYQPNGELPVGTTNTASGGHDGVTAVSYRIKYDASGNELEREQIATTTYSTVPAVIEVGVLNPDGSLATLNTETGEVTGIVETAPTDPSDSSADPSASDTGATEPADPTAPTESVEPTDTTPADTTPSDTTPEETPADTTPEETPADTTPAPEGEGEAA